MYNSKEYKKACSNTVHFYNVVSGQLGAIDAFRQMEMEFRGSVRTANSNLMGGTDGTSDFR